MASSEPPSKPLPAVHTGAPISGGANGLIYHHARGAVLWALMFNVIIAGMKLFTARFLTDSDALFSEGLHSLADSINSITLLVGITQGTRAPDRTHPFGYGLETNFWALFAALFLILSALWAIYSGVDELMNPMPFKNYGWAIGVLLISLVLEFFAVKTACAAVLQEVGVEANGFDLIGKAFSHIDKVVGPTTRFVFYEDVIAFSGAFIALMAIVSVYLSAELKVLPVQFAASADGAGSVIIGLLLLFLAFNLIWENKGVLTGAAAPVLVENKIQDLVLSLHGVSQVYDIKTIDQGISGLIVHMKVEVEPDTQVKDVDDLTERIKDRLQERFSNVRQVFIEVLADESQEEWSEKFYKLIEQGRVEGVLRPRDEAMLQKVYEFSESVLRDVMVPRTDVEYVEIETSLSEVMDLMIETGHSRIPVYKEHVDDIAGLVVSRDLFDHLRKNKLDTPLAEVIREIDIYPENKPVSDLLEDFKRKKIQMAAVADEHGGFSGIVTIEDLMEEIVGELYDESDQEESMIEFKAENQVLVNGKYDIEELNEQLGINIPDDEFKTVGGFVFGTLGREPEQGDTAAFEDLMFTVQEAEGPRIVSVLIESP
ncbi:MAG: cation diffusion facilitator family transporter, partial [Cyanobacteria bacterium]|nr:cation diffusion facilitator family transporter [Cyanobacteriota bacterium]